MKYCFVLSLLFINSLFSYAQIVVDNATFFNKSQKDSLEAQMLGMYHSSTVQSLIFTTNTLNGQGITNYGMNIFNDYGVGISGVNNGFVIVMSKKERQVQLLTGYGLEWILPDSLCQNIINDIIPFFKKGLYCKGLQLALNRIDHKVSGYPWEAKAIKLRNLNQGDNGKIIKDSVP